MLIPEENSRPEENKDILYIHLTNVVFIKLLVYSDYDKKEDIVFDPIALEINLIRDEPT